jgi:hypothetical protein
VNLKIKNLVGGLGLNKFCNHRADAAERSNNGCREGVKISFNSSLPKKMTRFKTVF